MFFQAEKNDLHRLLRDGALVAPKKSPKHIHTCLLIEAHAAANEVSVTANNGGEEIFTAKIAANVAEGGKVAISASDIVQVVKSLPVGVVEVSLGERRDDDSGTLPLDENRALPLTLRGGKAKITLETLAADEFPHAEWEENDTAPARMGAGDILRLINRTLYAASLEETRYYLGGCYLQVLDGDLVVTATDGHRLAQARTAWDETMTLICGSGSAHAQGAILSRSLLGSLSKLLESNRALSAEFQIIAGKAAWFESGDVRIQGSLVQGQYPDWRQVIPKSTNVNVTLNRATLIAALERVSLLSPDKTGGVRVQVNPDGDEATTGHVLISSQHTGRGQAQQPVDVLDLGESFGSLEIGLNAHLLTNALKVMDSGCVLLSFVNHLSPVMLQPSSDEGEVDPSELHIVMPMRL